MLSGEKIVLTGATGQVGFPAAVALAADNDVIAVSRFTDAEARKRLEEAGVTCAPVDLAGGDLAAVPDDATCLVNFAVSKSNDWDRDLAANGEGMGLLMDRCRGVRGVLHCSSTAVYQPKGHDLIAETDPLGDNHRVWDFLATYSISKIAAEAVVRTIARQLDIPTTIARLNVPYGDTGGWPASRSRFTSTNRACTTRSTTTTSSSRSARCSTPPRCPPRSSTGPGPTR